MNYTEALEWLYGLQRKGWVLGLERVKAALEILGHPEQNYKVIHIAGTNGKGSVTAMVTRILGKQYKVGMFTSPHLAHFRERIQVDGQHITEDDTTRLIKEMQELDLTFFECVTVMALKYFSERGCDYVVLETGMGGRLDATNVCHAEISAITSIDLDHTQWLGKTIEKIAGEKAGIIKGGGKVIVPQGIKGLEVIDAKCLEKNAQLIQAEVYQGPLSLQGDFQQQNAGVAAKICQELGLDHDAIVGGLNTTIWPGRLQFVQPGVLLDCAHNVAGMNALSTYVKQIRGSYERVIIVFGAQGMKYYPGMIEALPVHDILIFTQSNVRGAVDPTVLKHVSGSAGYVVEDPLEAVHHALSLKKEKDLVLICGSCYLVGNILEQRYQVTDEFAVTLKNR